MLAHLKGRLTSTTTTTNTIKTLRNYNVTFVTEDESRKETRLWKEVEEIDAICNRLALPYPTQQLSVRIYNRATEVREFEHESLRPVLIGVTIYCGCKLSRVSRPITDICSESKITVTELRKGYQIFLNNWNFISGSTNHRNVITATEEFNSFENYQIQQQQRQQQLEQQRRLEANNVSVSPVNRRGPTSPTQLQRLLTTPTPRSVIQNISVPLASHSSSVTRQEQNLFEPFGNIIDPIRERPFLWNSGIFPSIQNGVCHSFITTPSFADPHTVTSCNATGECHLRCARPLLNHGFANIPQGIVSSVPTMTAATRPMAPVRPVVTNPFKIPESHPLKRDLVTASNMIRESMEKDRIVSENTERYVSNIIATERAKSATDITNSVNGMKQKFLIPVTSASHPFLCPPTFPKNVPKHIPIPARRPLLWKRKAPLQPWYESSCGVSDSKLRNIQEELSNGINEKLSESGHERSLDRDETKQVGSLKESNELGKNSEEKEKLEKEQVSENVTESEEILSDSTNTTTENTTKNVIQSVNYHSKLIYNSKPKIRLGTQMKLTAHAPWQLPPKEEGVVTSETNADEEMKGASPDKDDEICDENNNCDDRFIIID